MTGVYVVRLPNGDHQLGADIEGHFVPFLTLSKGKVGQLVERAENLAARADAGDGLAADQIGAPVKAASKSAQRAGSRPKGGDS